MGVPCVLDVVVTADEGFCDKREDQTHCVCWWDCKTCCSCGHKTGKSDG